MSFVPLPPHTTMIHHHPASPRRSLYAVLSDEEYAAFGDIIRRMAFPSTSPYLTAVIRVTLYGWQTKCHLPASELDEETLAWIAWHKTRMTEEDALRQTYFDVLTEIAFPVIAARGAQIAFHLLQCEIERATAERSGIIPAYACMKTWTQVYATIHAEAIGRHRAELVRESTREAETERIRREEREVLEAREVVYE